MELVQSLTGDNSYYLTMKQPIFLLFIVLIGPMASAQLTEINQTEYTEKEGSDRLSNLLKKLTSQKDWQGHADSIRTQLRKGMELEVFPSRTPLNPRFRNKKTMDGYTVESVVFES